MSIENDFLTFACGSGANVEAQSTWAADSVLANGFGAGIANSAQANKVLRQGSIIASMIAQFIVDNSGQPAIDDGTTVTLEANLKAAINAVIAVFAANALGVGGTAYSPQFAALSASLFDASGAGQFRITAGSYGVIFRNDGGSLYILVTNAGSPTGTYNALRPIAINLATGAVTLDATGAGVACGGKITAASAIITGSGTVTGQLTAGSLAVSGQSNLGTGAYLATAPAITDNSGSVPNTAWVQALFAARALSGSGYQKLPGGLIVQWGNGPIGLQTSAYANFPIAFTSGCFAITANFGSTLPLTNNIGTLGIEAVSLSQYQVTLASSTAGSAIYGYWYIAVGL